MGKSLRQILLSGALLLAVTTALGGGMPVFCGFERYRGLTTNVYETCEAGAVYFDGDILFQGSSSRPDRADDRIVVWYRRASYGAAGELVVTAGFIDPNGLVQPRDYAVAAELEDGTYHRVTIRALENILEETQTLPGFVVFLDGERLACDSSLSYAAEPSRFPLGWAMRERYVSGATRAVFPSLGVKKVGAAARVAKIVRAGLQGAGGARNCVLTDSVTCDNIELPKANFRSGDEYYSDFADAMSALSSKATDAAHPALLRLLEDFTPADGVLEIPEGMFVTLDLAGRQLKGAIYVCGTLEVIDTIGGGVVVGTEDDGALYIDGGAATIRAGRWLSRLCADDGGLTIFAGEFFDESLDSSKSNGGFYLDGYGYLAKGSYLAKLDYENQHVTVAAADSSKVTVTFVYGATVWATSQYTPNGDDWSGAIAEPEATGYSFSSWLRSDGSVWTHDYAVKADQYVTAAFTNNRYTITFLADDGGPVWAVRSYTYGVNDLEMPEPPTKEARDFAGWKIFAPNDWIFNPLIAKNVTLKPHWEQHYEVIERPRSVAGLVFDGTLKTGVVEGVGYTLTSNTAINAGNYIAMAKLAANYRWSTGTDTARFQDSSVSWKISSFEDYAQNLTSNATTSGEFVVPDCGTAAVAADGRSVEITVGEKTATVEIRSYYDARIENGTLTLSMNETAAPTFEAATESEGGEEEAKSPIEISDKEFSVSLANVHSGFSYRIGTKNSLTDDWTYQDWQTVGDEATLRLSVKRGVAATSGFYVIEYTDEKISK